MQTDQLNFSYNERTEYVDIEEFNDLKFEEGKKQYATHINWTLSGSGEINW